MSAPVSCFWLIVRDAFVEYKFEFFKSVRHHLLVNDSNGQLTKRMTEGQASDQVNILKM